MIHISIDIIDRSFPMFFIKAKTSLICIFFRMIVIAVALFESILITCLFHPFSEIYFSFVVVDEVVIIAVCHIVMDAVNVFFDFEL